MKIEGSRILITGGGTGIGRALAEEATQRGARVAICGRRSEPLEEVAAATGAVPLVCDVADQGAVEAMVAAASEALGGTPQALVNNAAFGHRARLLDLESSAFEAVLRTNVLGAFHVGQAVARRMVADGAGGSILNIGSSAARKGYPTGSAYAASKFALAGLTECWRAELRQHDVRVIQVDPSEVVTPFGGREDLTEIPSKLRALDVAQLVLSCLELDDRGMVTQVALWATNPQ